MIPQSMSYADIAGLQYKYGLYTSILPVITYALMGTSRQLGVGPVAMVSLLVEVGLEFLGQALILIVQLLSLLAAQPLLERLELLRERLPTLLLPSTHVLHLLGAPVLRHPRSCLRPHARLGGQRNDLGVVGMRVVVLVVRIELPYLGVVEHLC